MIFWYEELLMDDKLQKKKDKYIKIIEKRSVWQKLPWKKSFYVLCLSENKDNLFEIMGTNQMFFRYYKTCDMYIVGVSSNYESAVEMLTQILEDGYREDAKYNPREVYVRERFAALDGTTGRR